MLTIGGARIKEPHNLTYWLTGNSSKSEAARSERHKSQAIKILQFDLNCFEEAWVFKFIRKSQQ